MSTPAEPPHQSHAPDSVGEHSLGSHRLSQHVVGQRVVVRRIVPGETGPTGGPAFTDTLGECLSWARGLCEVRTGDGTVATIQIADIVSGKPVPPRASVRLRTPARTVHLHAAALFPTMQTTLLGEWVLRRGGTAQDGRRTKRANSALAIGSPDVDVSAAAAAVLDHYSALGLAPLAQLVAGSEEEGALLDLGWVDAGGHAQVLVAPTSKVARLLPAPPPVADLVEVSPGLGEARIGDGARARVGLHEEWACLADLWVAPAQRRTGLARAVMSEAVDWAASRGATTLHLQVEDDNHAAQQLYRTLGFTLHHAYRFLRPA